MPEEFVSQARLEAREALARIGSHERECARRYDELTETLERIERRTESMNTHAIMALTGVVGVLLAALATLAFQILRAHGA